MKTFGSGFLVVVLIFFLASCTQNTVFTAALSGAGEVPPVVTTATGTVTATLQGNTLTITGSYSGLSGPATAAHIHGPASTTQTAGVLVQLTVTEGSTPGSGTISGESTELTGQGLTTQFVRNDLEAGLYYINVHTTANPAGEIRGQLLR